MRFYLNEASLQGQFEDPATFRTAIEALLAVRARTPALSAMRVSPIIADRYVSYDLSLRQIVQSWHGSPVSKSLLAWITRNGPFVDEDRLPEQQDLFFCMGIEVTDGALGECARRRKAQENVASISFQGGEPDFAASPLSVVHGFEEEPIAAYDILNFWDMDDAYHAALGLAPQAQNWRETVERARERFANLTIPDAVFENRQLSREPFDAVIRDQIYRLLSILDDYMANRTNEGIEGEIAKSVVRDYFNGDRALFSAESPTNREQFKVDLTFPNPDGGDAILAHWHGKISRKFYRIHFEWPVAPKCKSLKILYIGPKITKS